MEAIALLKDDHKQLRALLARLEKATPRTQLPTLKKVEALLKAHVGIEEQIFYPAFQDAGTKKDDDTMYFEALEEHRAAGELVLPDLLRTSVGTDQFGGRAKVLKELVEHHAREEEKEMFPRARELLDLPTRKRLGEQMAVLRKTLLRKAG